ncbi:hypothetical protein Bca4012_062624 [Brassica carinata]
MKATHQKPLTPQTGRDRTDEKSTDCLTVNGKNGGIETFNGLSNSERVPSTQPAFSSFFLDMKTAFLSLHPTGQKGQTSG